MVEALSLFLFFVRMPIFSAHIKTAAKLVTEYRGDLPFAAFLKNYFRANRKHGSRDRKQIAALCYAYFRAGYLLGHLSIEDQISAGYFLVCEKSNDLLLALQPEWNEKVILSINEKLRFLGMNEEQFTPFPFPNEISEGIDIQSFHISHVYQPDLFLRIRPGYQQQVVEQLSAVGIPIQMMGQDTIALPNETPVQNILDINKTVVVQDFSSQRTASLLLPILSDLPKGCEVWDCCAASGGKSIMLYDLIPGIKLTVSDLRNSILENLKTRFREAGILNYRRVVADLAESASPFASESFDVVVADVPCSGSGTWGRTPEYLRFFKREQIAQYSALQKKILANVVSAIRKNGYLLYITCSVYKEENEANVDWLCERFGMRVVQQQCILGYTQKADTMFAALLQFA